MGIEGEKVRHRRFVMPYGHEMQVYTKQLGWRFVQVLLSVTKEIGVVIKSILIHVIELCTGESRLLVLVLGDQLSPHM